MKRSYRIIAILLTIFAVLSFAACGGESGSNDPVADDSQNVSGRFVFSYYGTDFSVNDEASAVIGALGDALSYFEAESCAFDGLDKTYTYAEFVIVTYPEGDKDFISTIRLTADTVATAEGISLGSSLDDVINAYGSNYTQDVNSYIYTKGDSKLMFIVDADNSVTSITYSIID